MHAAALACIEQVDMIDHDQPSDWTLIEHFPSFRSTVNRSHPQVLVVPVSQRVTLPCILLIHFHDQGCLAIPAVDVAKLEDVATGPRGMIIPRNRLWALVAVDDDIAGDR